MGQGLARKDQNPCARRSSTLPDEATQATPATEAAPVETPAPSAESVYDQAVIEMLEAPAAAPEAPAEPAAEPAETPAPETPEAPAAPAVIVTDGVRQLLSRAGLKEDFVAGWDQARLDGFAGFLAKTQAEQDRLGAETGRAKAPKAEPKPEAATPPPAPRAERLKAVREWAIDQIGPDAAPMVDLMEELDRDNAELREQAQLVPHMASLVTEVLVDMGLTALERDYPSVSKPEARRQVEERFWLEWNTGAYAKEGVPLRQQLTQALASAAKVTFNNVTEQSAAAALAATNKARLSSQPKIGSTNTSARRVVTADDVYNEALAAIPELTGR